MDIGSYINWFGAEVHHAIPPLLPDSDEVPADTTIPIWVDQEGLIKSLLDAIVKMQRELLTMQVLSSFQLIWLQHQQLLSQIRSKAVYSQAKKILMSQPITALMMFNNQDHR